MARPVNDDLNKSWKVSLPATLAGRIEFMLSDPIHHKPLYGARGELLEKLLEWWVARETGQSTLPHVPSLLELREQSNA